MKKHGLLILVILSAVVVASLSMPVMAEKMIQASQDKVVTQQGTDTDSAVDLKDSIGKAPELPSFPVTDEAMVALEGAAREAYAKVFGESIPDDYKAIKAEATEEEGDMRFTLSLMPANWEESTDALTQQQKQPFYVIGFGGVDTKTGAASVIGLQKFWLGWEDDPAEETKYTGEQLSAMETAARSFADKQGFEAGELVSTDNVSGSFGKGCVMVFALSGGKTVSVTVGVDGTVSGYSMVEGKG